MKTAEQTILIENLVKEASKLIAPAWSLKNFVASNPLQGFETRAFREVVKTAVEYISCKTLPASFISQQAYGEGSFDLDILESVSEKYGEEGFVLKKNIIEEIKGHRIEYQTYRSHFDHGYYAFAKAVNTDLIKWLELFFDQGQAIINMPYRKEGLFKAWRKLAIYEDFNPKRKKQIIKWIKDLPDDPNEVIYMCLERLGFSKNKWQEYLTSCLFKLNGWSSLIKWMEAYNSESQFAKDYPVNFSDYLAVRLSIEVIKSIELNYGLWNQIVKDKIDDSYITRSLIILETIEKSVYKKYRQLLKTGLDEYSAQNTVQNYDAQLVFCIDVRSEPFRKALESTGNYETYGFAGFFGMPIKYEDLEAEQSCDSCPVLIKPKHHIKESSKANENAHLLIKTFNRVMKDLKMNLVSPFIFSEATGLFYGFRMVTKTLFPGFYKWFQNITGYIFKINSEGKLNIDKSISIEEQVVLAQNALLGMGLTDNFAPAVIFCGHGSTTENNPAATALDCGACGGSHGGPNARVLAEILNKDMVRQKLKNSGIVIPESTRFYAAQHDTTTDAVHIYGNQQLKTLQADLKKAQKLNVDYRLKTFGSKRHPELRSRDWSETRPEWGLARNANFIIAPRAISKNLDLEGRCFLHSYDPKKDPEAKVLEVIMTAPMIVTQWINAQYYFSAVDNVNFGSGNKMTQNIMGTHGVIQGNSSDLMHGLPMQSIYRNDNDLYHMPVRITNYIYAKPEHVKNIINKHEILQNLVNNKWIHIVAINPEDNSFNEI